MSTEPPAGSDKTDLKPSQGRCKHREPVLNAAFINVWGINLTHRPAHNADTSRARASYSPGTRSFSRRIRASIPEAAIFSILGIKPSGPSLQSRRFETAINPNTSASLPRYTQGYTYIESLITGWSPREKSARQTSSTVRVSLISHCSSPLDSPERPPMPTSTPAETLVAAIFTA